MDGAEAEGEGKVQRKFEVRRVHVLIDKPSDTSYLDVIQCYEELGGF